MSNPGRLAGLPVPPSDLQEPGDRGGAAQEPDGRAGATRPKDWVRVRYRKLRISWRAPEGPDVEGEELDDDEEEAQGDEAAQDPQDHPLEQERDADEEVGRPRPAGGSRSRSSGRGR